MSIAPRPEAAPFMGDVHEELGHFLSYFTGDRDGLATDEIASLTLTRYDSDVRDERFFEAMQYLIGGKAAFSDDLIKLRRSSFAFIAQPDDPMILDKIMDEPLPRKRKEVSLLRALRTSDLQISQSGFLAVIRLLQAHSTLSSLYLVNNGIKPTSPYTMQHFAMGLNMSNLRTLEINNNPIGTRSIVQLLDNINAPSLTHLKLSMTMLERNLREGQLTNPLWASELQKEGWEQEEAHDTWRKEISKVGNSIVKLVSRDKREEGYAPRLERLSLNGNDLGWRTVKKIVRSIVDSNRNLIEVELFATMTAGDSDDEEDEPTGLKRVISIGTMYYRNQQANRTNHGQGNATPPRKNSLKTESMSAKIALTKESWRGELGRHLWKNRLRRKDVKDASRYILPIARVLTCKCREGPGKPYFPFTKLPPEIRAKVILYLDDKGILTSQQMKRILSFASNPATLGYGCMSKDLGLSELALQQIRKEAQGIEEEDTNDYGLIPHHRWSWQEMIRDFPMPRDWPATILDENMRRSKAGDGEDDHSETEGLGGGGPDGLGGVTYERAGPDAARRRWLEEQSGLHAFWESTGTYREE